METMAVVSPSLRFTGAKFSLPKTFFVSSSVTSTNPVSVCGSSVCLKSSVRNQVACLVLGKGRREAGFRCWASTGVSDGLTERWILEPTGDGDFSHIGYKVTRPGAFEIVSDSVVVGRVSDKADVVLPVATVSGMHARLEKKDGLLLVTDLGSTNGTFINEKRLTPGDVTPAPPGSYIVFGDTNLAIFRVIKAVVASASTSEESESGPTSEPQSVTSETTS